MVRRRIGLKGVKQMVEARQNMSIDKKSDIQCMVTSFRDTRSLTVVSC